MRKTITNSLVAGTVALFLVTACAEDSKSTEATAAQASANEEAGATADQGSSIMDQPVDFSTPENVEISLEKIREQEGGAAYNSLKNALGYLKAYDLSVGNSDEKLYKKLDGQTPNAIIAKMKR